MKKHGYVNMPAAIIADNIVMSLLIGVQKY
jgi:hypothetical protein